MTLMTLSAGVWWCGTPRPGLEGNHLIEIDCCLLSDVSAQNKKGLPAISQVWMKNFMENHLYRLADFCRTKEFQVF